MLPRQADCFQDRTAVAQLEHVVAGGGTAVLCQVLAGMGGVGKTQLAAHYARTLWQAGDLDLLMWISAATRSAIVAAYAQAAADVLGADPAAPEQVAQAFLAWLEPRPGTVQRSWLVVLDDLADPADLRGLWPPASPHGRTLATTRRRDASLTGSGRHLVPVGLFTPAEALVYLTTVLAAHGRTEPADQLAALAVDLGHLPLALSQAVAYLIDADLDCAVYRTLLDDRAHILTDVLPDLSALPDDQPTPVAAAWSLSIDRADQMTPTGLARPVLQLASLLDPNGIPAPVLDSEPALALLTKHRTNATEQADVHQATAGDVARALRTLHRLSLIDHNPRDPHQSIRIHQLIQRATRDALDPEQRDQLARAAADALIDAWPDIERDTALAQTLRANTEALTRCAEDALYQADGAHAVLFRVGRSLGEAGQVAAAVDYYQHLVGSTHDRLGPDHPDTRIVRLNLGYWRGVAGDAVGAAAATEELLEHMLRVLDPGHPDILTARGHLAQWWGKSGDPAGAANAFAELVADRERMLGPDHPEVLTARGNLASWRGEAGDAVGAAAATEELLDHMLRVLDPDHPEVLATRGNLASWRGVAGDAVGAAAAAEELLADLERVFGPDHPNTLAARGNLATWRGEAGDPAGAAAATEELLDHMLRVLDPGHPDILTAREHLASWRGEAGDAVGAAAAAEELLADLERVFGPDHPNTLATRNNLATWQGEAGDPAGAAAATEELLDHMLRVLDPDHPDILTACGNLASWRGVTGDAVGAAAAFAELLDHMLPALGPDHPHTLAARNNLTHWRGEAGDAVGAAAAFAELLTDCERVLGPDHPDTLSVRHNLATWQDVAKGSSDHQSTDS